MTDEPGETNGVVVVVVPGATLVVGDTTVEVGDDDTTVVVDNGVVVVEEPIEVVCVVDVTVGLFTEEVGVVAPLNTSCGPLLFSRLLKVEPPPSREVIMKLY